MSTSPIQLYFWVSWDGFEWIDKNSHLRPNNLTGVRKSQTIKDERGMCECGNFKNPLQTVVLFLLTLVIWSCSVSWLLSSGLLILELSPTHIPETIYSPADSIFYLSPFSTQPAWEWPKFLIVLTCQHPSFQVHIGDTFWHHFPSFLPDFCSFLPFLLLRPNSCGPVTFGLQALVELHMRLQENSEYKLSRALNTTWYSQKASAYFNI